LDGGVVARSTEGAMTADQMDVYLLPTLAGTTAAQNASQVDRIVAQGNVVLQQPNRRATGQHLDYAAALDQYILTGDPRLVDAVHGTVSGAALTFYGRDDKVLVEGGEDSRAVTHTTVPK
jgi:lipopolysaccharide export system protein LptA